LEKIRLVVRIMLFRRSKNNNAEDKLLNLLPIHFYLTMRFIGKKVIITGGSGGIGLAATRLFASEGAQVTVWDKFLPGGMPAGIEFFEVDVSQYEAVEIAAANLESADILINNAGILRDATLQKMTPHQWQAVIDVNLTGVFNCTKVISPLMIQQSWGRIINTASVVALYGNYGQSNYVAAKSGVVGLTKVWARELGKFGITVNAVAPGFIDTGMIAGMPDKVMEKLLDRSALKRIGSPEDVAKAYAFLASDDAAFITGTVLSVDGGATV
jgi:3-oxoacyl-[acyl-carrier protein] reductase